MNRKIIFSIVGGAVLLAILIIVFFTYRAKVARGMELEIMPPEKVLIGVPFDLKIGVANTSRNDFKNIRVDLRLPAGMAFVGLPATKNTDYRSISALNEGGSTQQTFKVIALEGENTFKKIEANATYSPVSFNAQFTKDGDRDIAVGAHGIALDILSPQRVFNGTAFETEVSFKNNSGSDLSDLKLRMDFPLAFSFAKATIPPDIGNNVWVLGNLKKGSEIRFKITGNLVGPEGALYDIAAVAEAVLSGHLYPINTNAASIAIATSPISLKINLNNDNGFIAQPGSDLRYTIDYINNADISLRDLIIKAKLAGDMYDLSTISTNGTFRSTDNSIVWTAANLRTLTDLAPSQTGSVSFNVRTKNTYPVKKATDKNFTLKSSATIDSPTVPYFVAEGKTESFANLENKISGKVGLETKAYFRDPNSGITNKGSLPMRLNQPTNFTVHWLVTNYATDISDVEIRAFLGGNVRATGVVHSNTTTLPTYNDRTQEMIWRLPKVEANKGVIGKPIEAVFQIEAIPSSNDLNREMILIQDSSLRATDDFTGVALSASAGGVNTQSLTDALGSGTGVVLQNQQVLTLQQQHQQEQQQLVAMLRERKTAQQLIDAQLKSLQDKQLISERNLQAELEAQLKKYQDAAAKKWAEVPVDQTPSSGSGAGDACRQDAADSHEAELRAVDDNHDDDLNEAIEKRRNLLIAAALVGDPHLRHIAIVAALVGYEKAEKEIVADWNEGRANADRKYQQDLAACASAEAPTM